MFCIDNRCTDVYFNLAVEEYLLKQTQGDYFVIWQSEPSVVMGKNQSVRAEVNEDYRIEKGIRLARRFSGGGAVYHDKGNINLTFIETTSQPPVLKTICSVLLVFWKRWESRPIWMSVWEFIWMERKYRVVRNVFIKTV